jgi:hypothetical protein
MTLRVLAELWTFRNRSKVRSVPLLTMQALRERGEKAPTHSRPRHEMWVVSVTPRSGFTPEKWPPVPIVQEAGWASEPVCTRRLGEEPFASAGDRTPGRPRRYTVWAITAPLRNTRQYRSLSRRDSSKRIDHMSRISEPSHSSSTVALQSL